MKLKIVLIIVIALLILPAAFYSEIKNLTQNNKISLSQKVKDLQKNFYKIKRGRKEVKPANPQEFSIILKIISTQEEMLNNLTTNYILSHQRSKKIIEEKKGVMSSYLLNKISRDISTYLGGVYDISAEIKASQNFFELDRVITCANFQLNLYPLRIFLYSKFLQDIHQIGDTLLLPDKDATEVKKILSLEEEILAKVREKQKMCNVQDVEEVIKKEIEYLSRKQFEYLEEVEALKKGENSLTHLSDGYPNPSDGYPAPSTSTITYTIRFEDRLILIYGKEEVLGKIKEDLKTKNINNFDEIMTYLKTYKIDKVEIFYRQEKEKNIYRGTVRSAILDDVIPMVEGLTLEEAEKIFSYRGYNFFKNISEDEIKNIDRAVILSDTNSKSEILIIE